MQQWTLKKNGRIVFIIGQQYFIKSVYTKLGLTGLKTLNMRELIIQNWIFIATGTFLAILGILVQKLRLYSLIAGYNTSSAKTVCVIKLKKINAKIENMIFCFIVVV